MELLTLYGQQILMGALVVVNLFSFFVMAYDKRKAVRGNGADRIPEGFLFFMAIIFGGLGVYAGMFAFRHKIRKWYFQLGIPLLIFQNLATTYLIWEIFIKN